MIFFCSCLMINLGVLILSFQHLLTFYLFYICFGLPRVLLHNLFNFLSAFHLLPLLPIPPSLLPLPPLALLSPPRNIDSKSLQSEKIETEMWGWVCIWRGVWVSHFCVAGESHFLSGCKLSSSSKLQPPRGGGRLKRGIVHTHCNPILHQRNWFC